MNRLVYFTIAAILVSTLIVEAAPTREQRKELGAISKAIAKLVPLAKRKKWDELKEGIEELAARLDAVGLEDSDKERSKLYQKIVERLAGARAAFPVSFESEIAPIIKDRCLACHGANDPRGRRRLDTWAMWKLNGPRGPIAQPRNARNSLLIAVMIEPRGNPQIPHMPAQGGNVPRDDIELIARWINQGAPFDGTNENALIGTSKPAGKPKDDPEPEEPKREKPEVKVVMADGTETVSFSKDIAPWMVNLCMRCHGDRNPRSGFSLTTFEKLMQGGDTDDSIVAGELDASYLWSLVGKQDPLKMPPGQALITRTNWQNLKTWIEEGAKFDGDDPKKNLRELVPTAAERKAMELAKLSPAQLLERRSKQATDAWKEVLPREEAASVETKEFNLMGNVADARLREIGEWAEDHAKALRSMFNEKDSHLWTGKLNVFVAKDRFSYEEFNQVLLDRQTPRQMTGHSVVTENMAEAYLAMQDVGDDISATSPGLKVTLIDHLTGAYLKRTGEQLPDWLVRGTGLAMGARSDPSNDYIQGLTGLALGSMKSLRRAEDIFKDGTFSPADVGPVGFTVVRFLLQQDSPKFSQLVSQLQAGTRFRDAVQSVYRVSVRNLADAYVASMQ